MLEAANSAALELDRLYPQARDSASKSMLRSAKRVASTPRMTPSRNFLPLSPPARSSSSSGRSRAAADSPPARSVLFCEPRPATTAAGTSGASPATDPSLQTSGEVSSSSLSKRAQSNGKGLAASPRRQPGRDAAKRIGTPSPPECGGAGAGAGHSHDDMVDEVKSHVF